ncbi:MAG: alpha/beta fold hydrolase [Alphaproteobacteria bacterium]|nr:alpha/beta fold hydrolase [Alphaproteobacteria bacterium]
MKWVGRILLVLVVLVAGGGAAAYYLLQEPAPDERLVCDYGVYDFPGGAIASVNASSGRQNLRMTSMTGETWFLQPAPGSGDIPTTFTVAPGWTEKVMENVSVTFAPCGEGKLTIAGNLVPGDVGTRRALEMTDVTFESHGQKLFGRLVMPQGDGPVPIAVLVHGSERDSAVVFNRLAYLFPGNGIGVFVYDKRGTGKSEGTYTQDFDLLADDAAAALNKAREMAGARAREVGFQGGSQAGWIEPLAATKTKADFVLVGFGLAASPVDEDRDCVEVDLRDAGYGDDVIAKAHEITDATAVVITSHFTKGYEQLEAVKAKYGSEPWYKVIKGQYTGLMLSYPSLMLRYIAPLFEVGTPYEYDSLPPLKAYDGPELWVLAGQDHLAPDKQTLKVLRELQVDKPQLSVVVFPSADHGILEFERQDGKRVETRFSAGYFDLIVDWIKTRHINVPADSAVVYSAASTDTPPSGDAVMDTP